MFEKIKYYYNKGIYKDAHLLRLVSVGAITQTEYEEIKGDV